MATKEEKLRAEQEKRLQGLYDSGMRGTETPPWEREEKKPAKSNLKPKGKAAKQDEEEEKEEGERPKGKKTEKPARVHNKLKIVGGDKDHVHVAIPRKLVPQMAGGDDD